MKVTCWTWKQRPKCGCS